MLANLLPELTARKGNDAADVLVGDEGIGEEESFHLAHEVFGIHDGLLSDRLVGSLKDGLELRLNLVEELGDRFILILHFHVRLSLQGKCRPCPPYHGIIKHMLLLYNFIIIRCSLRTLIEYINTNYKK